MERLHPQSPDYSVQLNYLETMINLPWGEYTKDNINLKNAEKTLDKDHYGLEKVKERIRTPGCGENKKPRYKISHHPYTDLRE